MKTSAAQSQEQPRALSNSLLRVPRHIDRNSLVNMGLIALSVAMALGWHPLWLLLWPGALLLDDFVMLAFNFTAFDTEKSVIRGYEFGHYFVDDTSNHGRDLGFNLYEGDLEKTREQSQVDKWELMLEQLGLQPGDRLLDVGCGYGDWLKYARSKGIEVVGVNMSPEQVAYAREVNGLDVIETNWKAIPADPELQARLYGRFDAVTFMDTIEHYVHRTEQRRDCGARVYGMLYDMASKLLNPEGRGRVFTSCLHVNDIYLDPEDRKKLTRPAFISGLLMMRLLLSNLLKIRFHSGSYPRGERGLLEHAERHFDMRRVYDRTEDYRLTGVLDRGHFQAPIIKWTWAKVLKVLELLLLDPHHLHKWLDLRYDAWMNFYGEEPWDPEYNPEKRRRTSLMILYWHVLELRRRPSADHSEPTP